ncbi:glycine zipper 2TM domain-containing protein [Spongiibacter sp. KMU-158]|uniref:Glycine zipper 2TM domain-containing protein n=1 Tax=Spongiibacter pelagi TaxID=2760804 RepID=A0A927GVB0_9GAMM|nr:glycine zipper 2TM domain-containing protein [Spongiibacter pelagi]MBD2857687.1 glycine zipper 2TM domain-containing protein [Spongiibacter pelagi]
MDKSFLVGLLIGGATLGSAAGIAAYKSGGEFEVSQQPLIAEVISATPIKESYTVSHQECWDEVVEVPVEQPQNPGYQDENKVTGTAIGAILGGIIGNQVGGGSGKKLATIAGAVAGGYAGRKVQEGMQQPDANAMPESKVEQRCKTANEQKERITGYQVSYKIGEETGEVVMKEKPGETLPVVNGKVVTETQPPQA